MSEGISPPDYKKQVESQHSDEKVAPGSGSGSGYDAEAVDLDELAMSPAEEKAMLRRIDLKLVPYSTLLYLLSFLDRVNIGQANVAGPGPSLSTTLKIPSNSNQYAVALSVFFVGYVFFETPANLLLRYFKPHRFITIIMVLWGITMTLMSLVQNAAGLQAARFFLGVTEGPLYPGLNFLFSCWYSRRDMNVRVSIMFAGATLAGAFGGILAYALKHMNGLSGLEGWRYIFMIEGILTVAFAIPAYWLMPSFLGDDDRVLNAADTKKWTARLARSAGVTNASIPFTWQQPIDGLKDYKSWLISIMYLSIAQPLYALALFTPTIIAGLDFNKTPAAANLLSVPPYALGFITTMLNAYFSDKYTRRGYFLVGWMSVTLVGYIILICPVAVGVKYFAIFLTVAGVSPSIPTAISWVGAHHGPVYKRGAVMGLFFTLGNSGGLISSNIYPKKDAPGGFITGHSVSLAFTSLAIILAIVIMLDNARINRNRDAQFGPSDVSGTTPYDACNPAEKERYGLSHLTDLEVMTLGDKHPAFRYPL